MSLRTACLFLFAASSMVLASCQNSGNPLGGATRMLQAMGRSVGIVSDASKIDSLHLGEDEVERAREEADKQGRALPGNAPAPSTGSSENGLAFAR